MFMDVCGCLWMFIWYYNYNYIYIYICMKIYIYIELARLDGLGAPPQINVDIVVANFRLGLIGGATLFNLITKLNNGDPARAQ